MQARVYAALRAVSRACACTSQLYLQRRHTWCCSLTGLPRTNSYRSLPWVPITAESLLGTLCCHMAFLHVCSWAGDLAVRASIRHARTDTITLYFVLGACIAQPWLAMELQRLQWPVSSETGERLSLLAFLDRRSTKATHLHAYLVYVHSLYTPVQVCILGLPSVYTAVCMCKQLRADRPFRLVVTVADESCQA